MQGALERSHDNQYHLYNVDGYANHITEGAKVGLSYAFTLPAAVAQEKCCFRLLDQDGCGLAVLRQTEG